MKKNPLLLELKEVSKIYHTEGEEIHALDNVDFQVQKNSLISVLGPSGSGKSTLLHMLGLLDEPSKGKVYMDGTDTTQLPEPARAYLRAKKIGFIFQTFNLIPSLTVLENVALPAVIYETDEEHAEIKASKILQRIGMGDRLLHYPHQLSGGQKQRVAIARALVNDPELILADEPTGNLDSHTGQSVLRMFKELHGEGKSIIIITHDQNITKFTKRTIHIIDGKLS